VALSFSCSQAESTPAHTQVTQTVRLGTKADESAIQHLVKASSDTDGMVGNLAMNALIKIGKPTPSLIECVKNKSQSARLLALRAMAEIKDHCAIPVMMQVMDEESVPLQHWANEGLERLGLDMVYIKPV
jgi:HEAT repeat protein